MISEAFRRFKQRRRQARALAEIAARPDRPEMVLIRDTVPSPAPARNPTGEIASLRVNRYVH